MLYFISEHVRAILYAFSLEIQITSNNNHQDHKRKNQ